MRKLLYLIPFVAILAHGANISNPNRLTVKESDGSPSVSGVRTINVSNGDLTDDGSGTVTIDTTGGGGGGGAGGYDHEPATVTFQLDHGMTASTGTFTSSVTIEGQLVIRDTNAHMIFDTNGTNPVLELNTDSAGTPGGEIAFEVFRSTVMRFRHDGSNSFDFMVSTDSLSATNLVNRIEVWDGNGAGALMKFNPSLNGFDLQVTSMTFDSGSDDPVIDWDTDGSLVVENGTFTVEEHLAVTDSIEINGVVYQWPSADGSADQVLETNGNGTLSWATAGAASDTNSEWTKTWACNSMLASRPQAVEYDGVASNFQQDGTNISVQGCGFDDSDDEARGVQFIVPEDVDTSGTAEFYVTWYSSQSTSGSVQWYVSWHEVNEAEAWDAAVTDDNATSDATQGTVDQLTETSWTETLGNLGWAAEETIFLYLVRDGDGDKGTDDMTGDARAVTFTVKIPRT